MAHEDIRARLAALPEGRWLAESVRDGDEDGYCDEETLTGRWMAEEEVDADDVPFWYESPSGAVAEFITRAADDLRTLLARVEELEAEVRAVRGAHERTRQSLRRAELRNTDFATSRNDAVTKTVALRAAVMRPLDDEERARILADDRDTVEALYDVWRTRIRMTLREGGTDAP